MIALYLILAEDHGRKPVGIYSIYKWFGFVGEHSVQEKPV